MSNTTLPPALAGQVEPSFRPACWAWRDDDGQTHLSGWDDVRPAHGSVPLYGQAVLDAAVAAERERVKALVCRLTLNAETCDGDGPEVDTARKALACTILAAINGYESPAPAGSQSDLFVA